LQEEVEVSKLQLHLLAFGLAVLLAFAMGLLAQAANTRSNWPRDEGAVARRGEGISKHEEELEATKKDLQRQIAKAAVAEERMQCLGERLREAQSLYETAVEERQCLEVAAPRTSKQPPEIHFLSGGVQSEESLSVASSQWVVHDTTTVFAGSSEPMMHRRPQIKEGRAQPAVLAETGVYRNRRVIADTQLLSKDERATETTAMPASQADGNSVGSTPQIDGADAGESGAATPVSGCILVDHPATPRLAVCPDIASSYPQPPPRH